jgi:SAM-dependent methyltransferase
VVSEASKQSAEPLTIQTNPPSISISKTEPVRDPDLLAQALRHKLRNLTGAMGEVVMPCVPAMLEEHLNLILGVMKGLGQSLSQEQIESLKTSLAQHLADGFRASPHARLSIKFSPPSPTEGLTSGLRITANIHTSSLEEKYDGWVKNRSGPLFGPHPDAKIIDVAATFPNKQQTPILDVGAGTGRNTFPLARQGHPVDAVELTSVFAQQLLATAEKESLPVRIFQGNILDSKLNLPPSYYKLAVVSEVISHFRNINQVRILLAKLCAGLESGGLLLFNLFLPIEGYEPDETVRQMAEVVWSYLLTRDELKFAMNGLPLEIISEESVYEYEHHHLPAEAWPPTWWFVSWATGRNIFPFAATPPVELRWVLCRRK